MILGVQDFTASPKLCSFPGHKACMPWEGRKQVLCLPPLPLYCPQVQCHLILAVLKYIERIVPRLLGLVLT